MQFIEPTMPTTKYVEILLHSDRKAFQIYFKHSVNLLSRRFFEQKKKHSKHDPNQKNRMIL